MEHDIFVDKLVDILMRSHIISSQEAAVYREQFKESDHNNFDEFLIDEGLVSKEDLLNALSSYYQVPSVDVTGLFFDRELLRNFPKDFLLRTYVIPHLLDGNIVVCVAADPSDATLIPKMEKFVSPDVEFQVGLAREIQDAIKEYYDKAVTEVPDDVDLDEERRMREEYEQEILLEELED